MDGLFLDSEPQWHEAETLMMRENGYDWKPEDQLHCLGGPLRRVAEYMSNCLEARKSPTELEAMIIAEMTDRLSKKVPLMPGALAISKAIHGSGTKQGLVSASPRPIVDGVLRGMSEKYFDVTVGAGISSEPNLFLILICTPQNFLASISSNRLSLKIHQRAYPRLLQVELL